MPSSIISMETECAKAANILRAFTAIEDIKKSKSAEAFANAKGIAILSVLRVGSGISARGGSGILIARLHDGSWSAPLAIKTGGLGFGHMFGAEVTDSVLLLNTAEAVASFSESNAHFSIAGNAAAALGTAGRAFEAGTTLSALTPIISYSMSKGVYLGVSAEVSGVVEKRSLNAAWYGADMTPKQILEGFTPRPEEAHLLYKSLDDTFGFWTPSLTGAPVQDVLPEYKSSDSGAQPLPEKKE
ncbi:hypothetical protein HDU77_000639 [Chytriomyces hyalinus]|nr:hypothetical protein HDU77_000639 [Chytriomyces hyalinus]